MVVYLLLARRPARSRACSDRVAAHARPAAARRRAASLAFIYLPLARDRGSTRSTTSVAGWPIDGFTTKWFRPAWHDEDVRDALWLSVQGGARRDRVALVLGTLALARGRALPLLRPRDDLVPGRPADRAAGDHHRHRAATHRTRPVGIDVRAADDRDRARDLLHRHRLQQRGRAAAADVAARSRRRRPTSAPTAGRRSATSRCPRCDGAPRRRPARLRALVRRGDRHHFTAGAQQTLPIWIFANLVAAERAADRQRRRAVRDRCLDRSRSGSRSG